MSAYMHAALLLVITAYLLHATWSCFSRPAICPSYAFIFQLLCGWNAHHYCHPVALSWTSWAFFHRMAADKSMVRVLWPGGRVVGVAVDVYSIFHKTRARSPLLVNGERVLELWNTLYSRLFRTYPGILNVRFMSRFINACKRHFIKILRSRGY